MNRQPQHDEGKKKLSAAGVTGIAVSAFIVVACLIVGAVFLFSGSFPSGTAASSELSSELSAASETSNSGTDRYAVKPSDAFIGVPDFESAPRVFGNGPERITIWVFSEEVPEMVWYYVDMHPEFGEKYTVECVSAGYMESYQQKLDEALISGVDAPDIYLAEATYAVKYTKGEMSPYAATYKDLGIDVDTKLMEADICSYIVDIGSRDDGEVVGLGYQSNGCAMIYRASIARDVFGTDDPESIERMIGGGSGSWDKFFLAADVLREYGYSAVSGSEDVLRAAAGGTTTKWVENGELNLDSAHEALFDYYRNIEENNWSNGNLPWSAEWYNDMTDENSGCFCFFGPDWLLESVIGMQYWDPDFESTYGDWRVCVPPVGFFWGGTWLLANKDTDNKEGVAELLEWITLDCSQTGLQYLIANNKIGFGVKDTVASKTVMMMSDGTSDLCDGQNVFRVFEECNYFASGKHVTQYDEDIKELFMMYAGDYAYGKKKREAAITEFTNAVLNILPGQG